MGLVSEDARTPVEVESMTVPPDEPNQLHVMLTKDPEAKPGPAEIVAAILRHMLPGGEGG